jgi:pSer/pThr/pTyr-binding forkhead associated (FHA) protein
VAPPPAGPVGRLVCLNDGREYAVVTPFGFGRDAVSSVVIASPDASRRHAEIVTGPEGDVLVDLSSNGTFVNGQRVSARHALRALDVIRIGAEEFRYYPPAQPARRPEASPPAGAEFRLSDTLIGIPTPRPMQAVRRPEPSLPSPLASLLVKRGERKGERFPIRSPIVNLGRADYNDVSLPDPSVSASHAKLQLREGVWLVTDLGSTNGTAVDDQPVTEETALSPGCTLRVGEVHLLFEPRDEGVRATPGTTVLPRPEAPPPAPERPAPTAPREEPVLMPGSRPSSRSGVGIVIGVVVVAAAILAALVLLA